MIAIACRDGSTVEFEGRELGRSAAPRSLARWTEVIIWRTAGSSLVAEVAACSRLPGEVRRSKALVAATAAALLQQLADDRGGKLTVPVLDALDEAAENDAEVEGALADWEESHTTRIP